MHIVFAKKDDIHLYLLFQRLVRIKKMHKKEATYFNQKIEVPLEFKAYFSHFYFAKNLTNLPSTKSILPSFQTILIFIFGENASLLSDENTVLEINKCVVLGPIKHAFSHTLPAETAILVANFESDAFYRFFSAANFSANKPQNPDDLLDENCFTNLWSELKRLDSPQKQVYHILEFCKHYLKNQNPTSALLSSFDSEITNPIKSIAKQTKQSERNVQLVQKTQFGYSTKELIRYQRFTNAIAAIENKITQAEKVNWFDIIAYCNYYDQSQLIHDFKHFIGLTPTQYLLFQTDICNPKTR